MDDPRVARSMLGYLSACILDTGRVADNYE
jgi:hypothetical protein